MTSKQHFGTVLASSLALALFTFVPAVQSQTLPQQPASPDARSSYATTMERQMRAQGTDVRVQLDGDALDTLRVEWPTVHRSDIYRFVTSPVAKQIQHLGFSKVIFTNGSHRWEYNLTQESMISAPETLLP
ncbi:MAG TPA: hypothetical protein VK466_02260 [Terriglobales bacterium]|nr:hypothetical protein [Terriglobales bacterium]